MQNKTKNLILYSQARSGTTALMNTITTLNPYYNVHPYIDKKTEYLDVTDSYYPCDNNLKIIWDDEIDSYYWNNDTTAIVDYYSSRHDRFVNCNYCVPKLENNIITFDDIIEYTYKIIRGRLPLPTTSSPFALSFVVQQLHLGACSNMSETTFGIILGTSQGGLASICRWRPDGSPSSSLVLLLGSF